MATLLTKQELEMELDDFRHLLADFDYSAIKNITFLNLNAFLAYMENVEGNPFQRQFKALQDKLDILQPYLPFVSSTRANQFLEDMSNAQNDEESLSIKKDYTKILRDDFIKFSRTVKSNDEWQSAVEVCEKIRLKKEEMLLALQ